MNGYVTDFIINLSASIFFVFLGFAISYFSRWYKALPLSGLWHLIIKDQKIVSVILSTKPGSLPWSSPMASFYEVQAYNECSIMCSRLGIKTRLVKGDQKEVLKSENLILIGSPVSNEVTKIIWNSIEKNNPFSFVINNPPITILKEGQAEEKRLNEYFFKFKDIEYKPKLSENKPKDQFQWVEDYGLVMRVRNPLNQRKTIMLAMGCHGISTYGAMCVLLDAKFANMIRRNVGENDFMALIQFKFENNEVVFANGFPKIIHWHIIIYN